MAEISGFLKIGMPNEGETQFELTLGNERHSFSWPRRPTPDHLLASKLRRDLEEWRSKRKAPQWFGLEVCDELIELPWVAVLQQILADDPIVWIIPGQAPPSNGLQSVEDLRLLLAVWTDPQIPGLKKELEALAVLGDRVHTAVSISPDGDGLRHRLETVKPIVLHLAPISASAEDGALLYKDEKTGNERTIPAAELSAWLSAETRLIVLNTCHAVPAAQRLVRNIGLMTVTWAGGVSDDRALAFALFFYEQLLRGVRPADAILMFSGQAVGSSVEHRDLFPPSRDYLAARRPSRNPVVFVPDLASLNLGIVASPERFVDARPRGRETPFTLPVGRGTSQDEVAHPPVPEARPIRMEVLEAINPALLLNGVDPLKTLMIQCEAPRVVVEVTCDTGLGVSQVRKTIDMIGGMGLPAVSDFQFPVLYELLRRGVRRRPVNFGVRLLADGVALAEETKSSMWMGRDEWVDSKDTYQFLPAFIDPGSPAVREIWTLACPNVRAFTDSDSLDGESVSATDETKVDLYVKALYVTLRDLENKISYITVPPQPIGARSRRASGQRVRSPERVMEDRRGTCHDLSLLFAACMEHIRLYPLVVLVEGHTFVGYWRRSRSYERFWEERPSFPRIILDGRDLDRLVKAGDVQLLEATSVTKPGVSFSEACKAGILRLQRRFDAAIDVRINREDVETLE